MLSHHAPHHSNRHRIDIAMSPASQTWTAPNFPEGGVDQKIIGGLDLRQHQFIFFGRPPPEPESVLKKLKGKCARKWNRNGN